MRTHYKLSILLVIVSGWGTLLQAQVNITGKVTDSTGKPVSAASVTLVKKNGVILAFGITNATGSYSIRHASSSVKDTLAVDVNALGFAKKSIPVTAATQTTDFTLSASASKLPNVSVKSRSMLRKEGDTLNYDVQSFSNPQDRAIGDVIKKLPGVDVAENGQISVGGKPINRFYIDGDNLLDGRYNIATKSIPADAVSKIQVLENHQPTKVLKDLVPSDQAAMNIVLKDKARLRVMGTGDAAFGTPGVYNASANAMLFKKQVKFINYTKLNNTGNDLANDVMNFFSWEYQPPPALMSATTAGNPDLSKKRFLFNNAVLVTANDLVNLKNDWQLRINAYYLHDKQFQAYQYQSKYYLPADTITYAEKLDSRQLSNTFNTQFTLTANKKDYFVNNVTILENTPLTINADLEATGNGLLNQQFSGTTTNISNRFNMVRKLTQGSSYELFSYIGLIRNPETLLVQPGLYAAQLNAGQPFAALIQDAAIPTFNTDNYISFGIPRTRFKQQYKIGLNYQDQDLNSLLAAEQFSGSKNVVADSFINRLNWQRFRAYAQMDYSYTANDFLITAAIPVTYQDIHYTGRKVNNRLRNLPVTPRVGFRYNTGREDYIMLNYAYGNTWVGIDQVYDGYIMRNYRNFYSNGDLLTETQSHSTSAAYNFRNTLKIFFFSIGASYSVYHRNTISDQRISSTVQQATLVPFDNDYTATSVSGSISKYIFPLMTTIGGKINWQQSRSNAIQNGERLQVINEGYTFGLNLNTKFSEWLTVNYVGVFGTNKSSFIQNIHGTEAPGTPAVKRWQHAADASITFGKNLFGKLVADNYTYLVPGARDVRITFADAYLTYKLDKLKTDLEFSLTNIAGTDTYTNVNISANSITEAQYRIRPRMAMVKFLFRF
jgi:hypothetical protein